jgi:hypothetical protein
VCGAQIWPWISHRFFVLALMTFEFGLVPLPLEKLADLYTERQIDEQESEAKIPLKLLPIRRWNSYGQSNGFAR